MRICPTCRTQYTDDTLRYCLQDGAELVERLESDTPTVAFKKEHETVEHSAQTSSRSGVTTSSDEELTRVAAANKSGRHTSGLLVALVVVLGVLLVVVVAGALGTWLYLRDGGKVSTSSNNANVNVNGSLSGNSGTNPPTPIPYPSITPPPTPPPTPHVDSERAQQEVSQTIHGWKSMAESKNLDAYMGNYADTVDYYNHPGASRTYVRGDKSRAFEMYDSIRVNLSNMNVSVDESGNRATATFDKEWDFRGSRSSSGKVQSQLKLRNVNGQWLIVGERDLRVYYTR